MKFNQFLILIFISFILSILTTPAFCSGTEEVFMGIDLTEDALNIHVSSGGCTKKEDFKVEVNKGDTGKLPYKLTILRTTPDDCKGLLPEGVWIKFDKKELGLDGMVEFSITNKIGNTSTRR